MRPTHFLRFEGLAGLAAALAVYFTLDGPIWRLTVLALAPDLSMLAYLAGPRIGALGYNVVHTYVLPLALGAGGVWIFDPRDPGGRHLGGPYRRRPDGWVRAEVRDWLQGHSLTAATGSRSCVR